MPARPSPRTIERVHALITEAGPERLGCKRAAVVLAIDSLVADGRIRIVHPAEGSSDPWHALAA